MWLLFKYHLLLIINFTLSNSWNFYTLNMLLICTISIVDSRSCLALLALAGGAIIRSLRPVFDEFSLNKWIAFSHITCFNIPPTLTIIVTTLYQVSTTHSWACIQRRVEHALAMFVNLILELVLTSFSRFWDLELLIKIVVSIFILLLLSRFLALIVL